MTKVAFNVNERTTFCRTRQLSHFIYVFSNVKICLCLDEFESDHAEQLAKKRQINASSTVCFCLVCFVSCTS